MAKQKQHVLMSVFIAASLVIFCATAAVLAALSDGKKASPTATPTAQTLVHIVQPGETLSLIAKKYGVTVETLVALNDIKDPDAIEAGQELLVSAPPDWTPPPTFAP